MGSTTTLRTTAAALLALALASTALATPAASQAPNPDQAPDAPGVQPSEAVTTLNCLQVHVEVSAGPATFTYNCSSGGNASVDPGWQPEAPSSGAIPPCAGIDGDIVSAGPATVGITAYCQVYVQFDTTSSAQPDCYDIYYQAEAGPVTVTLTSTCSGSVDVDPTWQPGPGTRPVLARARGPHPSPPSLRLHLEPRERVPCPAIPGHCS